VAGCDVEENQLIGPLLLVSLSNLDGISCILEIDEIHPLDHAARVNVKTGNDTLCQHETGFRNFIRNSEVDAETGISPMPISRFNRGTDHLCGFA
jgi:hypothetical protein